MEGINLTSQRSNNKFKVNNRGGSKNLLRPLYVLSLHKRSINFTTCVIPHTP